MLFRTSLLISLIAIPSVALSNDASSPESCSFQERSERTIREFADKMLDVIPSALESCALGNQIPSSGGGGSSSSIFMGGDDFFCGFGAQDVWEVAQRETLVSEKETLNRYLNRVNDHFKNGDSKQEILIPGTSTSLPESKIFKHIYKRVAPDS